MLTSTVALTPEADGSAVNVEVPALPGVLTWGLTVDEALSAACEAVELRLEGILGRGRAFLPEEPAQGEHVYRLRIRLPIGADRRTA